MVSRYHSNPYQNMYPYTCSRAKAPQEPQTHTLWTSTGPPILIHSLSPHWFRLDYRSQSCSREEVGTGYTKDLYHPGKKPRIEYYVSHGDVAGQQGEPPG